MLPAPGTLLVYGSNCHPTAGNAGGQDKRKWTEIESVSQKPETKYGFSCKLIVLISAEERLYYSAFPVIFEFHPVFSFVRPR
jgi:hypothetical protein